MAGSLFRNRRVHGSGWGSGENAGRFGFGKQHTPSKMRVQEVWFLDYLSRNSLLLSTIR